MTPRRLHPRHLPLLSGVVWGLSACPVAAPPSPEPTAAARTAADDTVVAVAAEGATQQVPGRVIVGGARAVVAAPLALRLKRLLVLPGDAVARGAAVAEVAIPEVADAAATLRGARARRAVVQKRRDWLQALRQEGVPRVADELAADADLADLEAAIARSTALLRVVDVDTADAALDELAVRGSVTLRAPVAGAVVSVGDASAGVVVGAVVPAGVVLVGLVAEGAPADRIRVVVRLPVNIKTPPTATALIGGGLALRALPGHGPVDMQDGANDRTFALAVDAADRDAMGLASGLIDGQGVTVTLPLAASRPSSSSDGSDTAGSVRVPASSVRLGGDGVAVVAVSEGNAVVGRPVQVRGRVGADLIVDGVPAGVRVKRDARSALASAGDGGGHDH